MALAARVEEDIVSSTKEDAAFSAKEDAISSTKEDNVSSAKEDAAFSAKEDAAFSAKEDAAFSAKEDGLIIRVMSYNVENLFDAQPDTLGRDSAFRIEGEYHWTARKYYEKLHHVAQVICAVGEWSPPAIVGLQEVENRTCLEGICRQLGSRYPYAIVHFDSPDRRGIDVGLLYDSTRLKCHFARPIAIPAFATRDILYSCFQSREITKANKKNTSGGAPSFSSQLLHCFVCHFPSQLGGAANTSGRRDEAFRVLQTQVDSLLRLDSLAQIVVMGDFNSEPEQRLAGLHNAMVALAANGNKMLIPEVKNIENAQEQNKLVAGTHKFEGKQQLVAGTHTFEGKQQLVAGTHKFEGQWSWLDQFYFSSSLQTHARTPRIFAPEWLLTTDEANLGVKPFRTHRYTFYLGGYSDHLPIYTDIIMAR